MNTCLKLTYSAANLGSRQRSCCQIQASRYWHSLHFAISMLPEQLSLRPHPTCMQHSLGLTRILRFLCQALFRTCLHVNIRKAGKADTMSNIAPIRQR